MANNGGFFAIGKQQWTKACSLGLNHAVTLLVMARGTGRDNCTTSWSAESAFKYTGLAWRRGNDAIAALCKAQLATKEQSGKRPRYKLSKPDSLEDLIWLPNEFVTGAASEIPPLRKLREGQSVEHLETLVELYAAQDLVGDGGISRSLFRAPYDVRERICGRGPFEIIGFSRSKRVDHCSWSGPLKRFQHAKVEDDSQHPVWIFLRSMERMGLLERATYLVESDNQDAELIHQLEGDDLSQRTADAAAALADSLPGGFSYEAQRFDFVLPIPEHMAKATVVGIMRLRYRPKTTKTAAWYGRHVESCARYEALYNRIAEGDFSGLAA